MSYHLSAPVLAVLQAIDDLNRERHGPATVDEIAARVGEGADSVALWVQTLRGALLVETPEPTGKESTAQPALAWRLTPAGRTRLTYRA